MSALDNVIARARQPGEMQTRRRFTVARKRAIQKMRKFALADPHHYILELIQSAVANGAAYVDIQIEDSTCTLAYIGGGLHEQELAQLFDFLFASKDRTDLAHVRGLALGLNAALRFMPTKIIVESGSAATGTTRMELRPGDDEVTIGKPRVGLVGTYIRIEGMKRKALGKAWRRFGDLERARELGVIEERCLTAPIPIWIDGNPVFGFGTQRIPRAPGYRKTIEVDEGDLYGVLGIDPSWGQANFALLTYGVHIQSAVHNFAKGTNIGGIICFDGLRKTVDHSGVVQDDRYAEMFARLAPYARQLLSGDAQVSSPYEVYISGLDAPLAVRELRELLMSSPYVVWAPVNLENPTKLAWAQEIARSLDAPFLRGVPGSLEALRTLASDETHFLQPALHDPTDHKHYLAPALGEPRRPWLVDSRPVGELRAGTIFERADAVMPGDDVNERTLRAALGSKPAQLQLFSPRTRGQVRASQLELRAADRVFFSRECPELGPCHVLVLEFPELSVGRFSRWTGREWEAVCEAIAEAALELAVRTVEAAEAEVVERLVAGHLEGLCARAVALHRLSHGVVARLDLLEATPTLDFVRLDNARELEAVSMFNTHSGRELGLAGVEKLSSQCEGLVYGTHPDLAADLHGLDLDRVVKLESGGEAALVALLDGVGYVRVDQRDVLAQAGEFVVRDRAFGLNPKFANRADAPMGLAWEHAAPAPRPSGASDGEPTKGGERASEPSAHQVQELLMQLIARAKGVTPPRPSDALDAGDWELCRREAAGHLRRFVCTNLAARMATPGFADSSDALWGLEIFAGAKGEGVSAAMLSRVLQGEGIELVYGDPDPSPELSRVSLDAPGGRLRLRADAFTARCLRSLGQAVGRPVVAEQPAHAPITDIELIEQHLHGDLRLWLLGEGEPAQVHIVYADGQRGLETDVAARYGIGGVFRGSRTLKPPGVASVLVSSAQALWQRVLRALQMEGSDHPRGARLLEAALMHVLRNARVMRDETGGVRFVCRESVAVQFARLPLVPLRRGGALSVAGLMQSLGVLSSDQDPRHAALAKLDEQCPDIVRAFIEVLLAPERVVYFKSERQRFVSAALTASEPALDLGKQVRGWLDALRTGQTQMRNCMTVDSGHPRPITYQQGVMRIFLLHETVLSYLSRPTPGAFARLLIQANDVMDDASTGQELSFHRALSSALRNGELDPTRPPVVDDALLA